MRIGENVTHRADGRWEARYIKGRESDGSAIYGFCYGKTREEAIQKRNDAELVTKNAVIVQPKLFQELYAMTVTDDTTARLAETLILPEIGDKPITSLSDSDLAALLQRIKQKSSATDVRKCFALLKNIFDRAVSEDAILISPVGALTMKYNSGRKTTVSKGFAPISEQEYLIPEQAAKLETALLENLQTKKSGVYIGLYLCLHLGLSRIEVSALQCRDIDFESKSLTINKIVAKQLKRAENGQLYETTPTEERVLPLPPYVFQFLSDLQPRYASPDDYLVYNKTGKQCSAAEYTRELQNINDEYHIASKLDLKMLRDTFIVRCIQNKIDIFTIAELTGITSISDFQSRYGGLFKTQKEKLCALESYTIGTRFDRGEPEKLNLLILGAGGYGHTVKEIAEKIGIFDKIAFLDDNTSVPEAIDICANFKRYKSTFPCAFPAFGDCALRKHWIDLLSESGLILPRIIDPSASISPSSVIADAVVIEANATISAQTTIGRGCIISSNALIDRGAVLSEAIHADSASTTTKDSFVPPLTKIESGTVYNNQIK